jgi:hypothetical protein
MRQPHSYKDGSIYSSYLHTIQTAKDNKKTTDQKAEGLRGDH